MWGPLLNKTSMHGGWKARYVSLVQSLPFYYGIWWTWNTTIFNNKLIPHDVMKALVVQWTREHKYKEKDPKRRISVPP